MENLTMEQLGLFAPRPLDAEEERLVAAVRARDAAEVSRLLYDGVRVERQMGMGWHPIVLAAQFGLCGLVARLHAEGGIDKGYYHEALHAASENGHRDLVYQVLGYGFDASSTRDFDICLGAMLGGHLGMLQEFMAKGWRTDLACPVYMEGVIEKDHDHMIKFMLEQGASVQTAREVFQKIAARQPKEEYPEKIASLLEGWETRADARKNLNKHRNRVRKL